MLAHPLDVEAARQLDFLGPHGEIDHNLIMDFTRKYTVVVDAEARVQEFHQNFIVYGDSEHVRWIEHERGYQNHGPIETAHSMRQTSRSRTPRPAAKASRSAARGKASARPRPAAASRDS
eukprot:10236241-Karenia_brevis.AAC.1